MNIRLVLPRDILFNKLGMILPHTGKGLFNPHLDSSISLLPPPFPLSLGTKRMNECVSNLPDESFLVLSYRGPVFRLGVSPLRRVNFPGVSWLTIQLHKPPSKSHAPPVGTDVGGKVGVVSSSLQHITPPALPTDKNEQPSRLPAAAV